MWQDYSEKMRYYKQSNPGMRSDEIGVLVTADTLHDDPPRGLIPFQGDLHYHGSDHIADTSSGHNVSETGSKQGATSTTSRSLNADLNVKFNDIVHPRNWRTNQLTFKKYSLLASSVIEEILHRASLPSPLEAVLKETEESRACCDYYQML